MKRENYQNMDQSLSLILENVTKVAADEYLMFSESNRMKSFQDWPFDYTTACNPKTVCLLSVLNFCCVFTSLVRARD